MDGERTDELAARLADSVPRVVWIELTSTCPFDCCFCSRKHERGNGEHMPLLRRYVKGTRVYAPFYWEDVEWGARAWLDGYRCLFVPDSRAVHDRRATIRRF